MAQSCRQLQSRLPEDTKSQRVHWQICLEQSISWGVLKIMGFPPKSAQFNGHVQWEKPWSFQSQMGTHCHHGSTATATS